MPLVGLALTWRPHERVPELFFFLATSAFLIGLVGVMWSSRVAPVLGGLTLVGLLIAPKARKQSSPSRRESGPRTPGPRELPPGRAQGGGTTKSIDVDSDPDVWTGIPWEWPAATWTDHRDWARDAAEAVFSGTRDRSEVDRLAGLLAFLAEDPRIAPGQAQASYVHVPGPSSDVLPVYVQFFDAEGERGDSLRELAEADGDAVEPPLVEPFTTERLGEGLRVLRYTVVDQDELLLSLAYAFRHDSLDIRVRTFTLDHGRVLRSLDDIEDLVRSISVVEQELG